MTLDEDVCIEAIDELLAGRLGSDSGSSSPALYDAVRAYRDMSGKNEWRQTIARMVRERLSDAQLDAGWGPEDALELLKFIEEEFTL